MPAQLRVVHGAADTVFLCFCRRPQSTLRSERDLVFVFHLQLFNDLAAASLEINHAAWILSFLDAAAFAFFFRF